MVGPGRLELPTSRLSGVRSNHLSYGPPGIRLDLCFAHSEQRVQDANASGPPGGKGFGCLAQWPKPAAKRPDYVREERETKAARSSANLESFD
jgi:hypothetical protein